MSQIQLAFDWPQILRKIHPIKMQLAEPLLQQTIFSKLHIGLMDIHPVKPWLLFCEKKNNQTIYLYDYQEKTILYQFSLDSIYNYKKQEISLIKLLEKSYNNIVLPEIDETLIKMDKVGEIKGIRLYDTDIIHWKLSESETFKKSYSKISKKMSFAGSIAAQQNYKSKVTGEKQRLTKRLIYNPRRDPRCILIFTDTRLVILKYDEDTTSFVFDEIKSSQLENKNIVCIEFLYTQPLIAIGCSDGVVRFYNYSINKMLDKKIVAHSKSLIKMIVILREDPINTYPSLLTCGLDGSLCLWNIDKGVAEYKIVKPFDNNAQTIVDMMYDPESLIITCIGSDRGIVTRRMTTGNLIKNVKLSDKTPMKSIDKVMTCQAVPSWYLMNAQNNRIYYSSCNLDSDQVVSFDIYKLATNWAKLKGKTQLVATHPLRTNLFFIGTTNGILMFHMDNKAPMVAPSFYVPTQEDIEIKIKLQEETPSEKVVGFDISFDIPNISIDLPSTVEKAIYYMNGPMLVKRVVGNNGFQTEKKIRDCNRSGSVSLEVSKSGKYISLFWENEKEFEIFSCDTWKCIATGAKTKSVCWGMHADTIAVLKLDNKLGVYWAVNQTLKPIAEMEGKSQIKQLFSGYLCGIAYENETLDFCTWDGKMCPLESIPCPKMIKWDRFSMKCVLIYNDSFSIFSYVPKFKMQLHVRESIESCMWWNGNLFVCTNLDIKCLFPTDTRMDSVVLASWDLVRYGSQPENEVDDSLDPIPQHRPKGILSLVDVAGDFLYLIDCKNQLHKITLSFPSIKFRMLVQSTKITQALGWLPLVSDELYDYLANFLHERGFHQEACYMENLTPKAKIENCIEWGYLDLALETLRLVDQMEELSHKELSQLYVTLACRASEHQDYLPVAEAAFERAFELKSSHAYHLITFYAKNQMYDKLQTLEHTCIDHGLLNAASMICLLLAKYKEASDHLVHGNEMSLAALLNTKSNLLNQNDLVHDWQNGLKTKYKNIPPVVLK